MALLLPFVPPLVEGVEGEDVGAYEGGILAAEEGAAGVMWPAAYGCAATRGHTGYLGRDAQGLRGCTVPAARGQQ